MIVRMHHFGMMTKDLEQSIKDFQNQGFEIYKSFEKEGMKAAMLQKNDARVELWEFENPDGELESKIKKHSAFVSDDLDNDVDEFINTGYELAIPISEGTVVKRYAYIKDSAGNYIELVEPED